MTDVMPKISNEFFFDLKYIYYLLNAKDINTIVKAFRITKVIIVCDLDAGKFIKI